MNAVDPQAYSVFLGAMLVMALSPGPAVILSLKTGFSGSKLSVLMCALGLNLGTLIWFCGVSFGLGALFLKLPTLILMMAVLGGLYLIYLGFSGIGSALFSENSVILDDDLAPQSMAPKGLKNMAQGFRVQLLNPKALLFFTAVLPPFLDPDRPLGPQFLIYGLTTLTMDSIAFVCYGLAARAVSEKFQNPLFQKNFTLISSALLGLMGMILIFKTLQRI
jgi:threonine/homoserine/homoserine lactone efflux protein